MLQIYFKYFFSQIVGMINCGVGSFLVFTLLLGDVGVSAHGKLYFDLLTHCLTYNN